MTFDYRIVWESLPFLFSGAISTMKASGLAIVLATAVGTFMGVIAASGYPPLAAIQRAYAYIIRGLPLLLLLFLVFFALPLLGLTLPAFTAGVLALGINSGAYISEAVRSGIQSIEREQWEASALDGGGVWQTLLKVILPQTLQRITAPITNELIALIKNSSLLAVIAVFELTRAAQIVSGREFVPFEMYSAAGLIYLVIVAILTRVSYIFEHRVFSA